MGNIERLCGNVATRVTSGDVTVQLRLSLEVYLGGGWTVCDGTNVDTDRLTDGQVDKMT